MTTDFLTKTAIIGPYILPDFFAVWQFERSAQVARNDQTGSPGVGAGKFAVSRASQETLQ
jgi:hypothetical protein